MSGLRGVMGLCSGMICLVLCGCPAEPVAGPKGSSGSAASNNTGTSSAASSSPTETSEKETEPDDAGSSDADKKYFDLTEKFGIALMKRDYPAAYALTSKKFQESLSAEDFQKFHEQEWATHTAEFLPQGLNVGVFTSDRKKLANEDDFGPLSDAPAETRRAWTTCEFPLEKDGDEVKQSFACGLLLVEEAGKLKVGRFEYEAAE